MAPADLPIAIQDIQPADSLALLRGLLTQYELDPRLLPSLKAALRGLELVDGHLRSCAALAERIDQGAL